MGQDALPWELEENPYLVIPTVHPAFILHGGEKAPIRDVIAADLAKAWRVANEGPSLTENLLILHERSQWGLQRTFEMALAWLRHWREHEVPVAIDVESSSLDYFGCQLFSVAVASADEDIAIAWTLADLHTLPWEMEQALTTELIAICANPRHVKVFHNSPFDRAVLHRKGIPVEGRCMDTMSNHHIIQPDIPKDLGWVGHELLDTSPWKLDHDSNKMANTRDIWRLLIYNARDAHRTIRCLEPELETIERRGMSKELVAWQNSFADLAVDMELYGLPINVEKRRVMGTAMLKEMAKLEHGMRDWLRWPDFNPMADEHKREVLFGKKYAQHPWGLGLTPGKLTKTQQLASTSYKSIIDNLEHPFVTMLVSYIESRHAYATQYREHPEHEIPKLAAVGWTEELIRYKKNPKPGSYTRAIASDGRMHVKVNPVGQKGTRFSTSPNVQNQKKIHRPFIEPRDGRCIVYSDKDQLELRLIAVLAGVSPLLEEMRREGGDPHLMNAAKIYGDDFWKKPEKERKNIRSVTKNVTYAGEYLAGWETVWRTCRENKRISPQLRAKMTKQMIRHVHASLFKNLYREIYSWHEGNLQHVEQFGFLEIPPLGRRRYCPVSPVPATEFANWSIQPVGSDIVTMEMVRIQHELKEKFHGRAGVILHGHDAVAIECDDGDAPQIVEIVDRHFGATYMEGPAGGVYLTAKALAGRDLLSAIGD